MNVSDMLKRLLVVLSIVTLAACNFGGQATEPTTAPVEEATTPEGDAPMADEGELPLFPGATEPESGSPMATVLDTMKDQMASQENEFDIQVDGYLLPEGTTFEDVQSFYNDELIALGWEEESTGDGSMPEVPGGGTAAWTNGDEEALAVVVMENPTAPGSNFLIVTHGAR